MGRAVSVEEGVECKAQDYRGQLARGAWEGCSGDNLDEMDRMGRFVYGVTCCSAKPWKKASITQRFLVVHWRKGRKYCKEGDDSRQSKRK